MSVAQDGCGFFDEGSGRDQLPRPIQPDRLKAGPRIFSHVLLKNAEQGWRGDPKIGAEFAHGLSRLQILPHPLQSQISLAFLIRCVGLASPGQGEIDAQMQRP